MGRPRVSTDSQESVRVILRYEVKELLGDARPQGARRDE
jgi:hypothetical protein